MTDDHTFLANYKPDAYPRPAVAVDLVVLTLWERALRLLAIARNEPPFAGRWALPGGFLRVGPGNSQGEDLEDAALRELAEETGLEGKEVILRQLGAFGAANRDPRMRVITVAYYALVSPTLVPKVSPGGDAGDAFWITPEAALAKGLAFDHDTIVRSALDRIRADLDRDPIAFALVPREFTVQELREVHEQVTGTPQDPGNFRKRVLRMVDDGLVEALPKKRKTATKPAALYRFKRQR